MCDDAGGKKWKENNEIFSSEFLVNQNKRNVVNVTIELLSHSYHIVKRKRKRKQ